MCFCGCQRCSRTGRAGDGGQLWSGWSALLRVATRGGSPHPLSHFSSFSRLIPYTARMAVQVAAPVGGGNSTCKVAMMQAHGDKEQSAVITDIN